MNNTKHRKDTKLTPEMQREVQKHHRALKQFIDVSFDSNSSVRNSKRALKAREKLLLLSQAQFVELSIDVYDELQRRINETRDEPDHLLPKDSYLPERNQARAKLLSLPAKRFKDLVNDILYEIEKRELHIIKDDPQPPQIINEQPVVDLSQENTAVEERIGSTDSALQASQHGVQSKTVIPTKATMAWSSDEEEEPEAQANRSVEQEESKDRVPEMMSPSTDKRTSGTSIRRGLSINKDREIQMLLEEGTKMDGKITDLEKLLEAEREKSGQLQRENEALMAQLHDHKDKVLVLERQVSEAPNKNELLLLQSQYDALQSSHSIVSEKHNGLLDEHDLLKEVHGELQRKLESLQSSRELMSPANVGSIGNGSNGISDDAALLKLQDQILQLLQKEPQPVDVEHYKDEIATWKQRFEDVRAGEFEAALLEADLSEEAFQEFVSDSGLVSFKQLADFQAALESFYLYFNNQHHNKADLLKATSLLVTRADLMCGGIDDKVTSIVKACITHAIVVARHYLTHGHVLTPIVLNVAVNDLAMSVCDLIKSVKLLSVHKEKKIQKAAASRSQVTTPAMNEHPAPGSYLDRNDTDSPVRPLKMIERLNSPGVAGSGRAPNTNIVTQTAKGDAPNASLNGSKPMSSPRGPGFISLATKFNSPASKNGSNADLRASPTTSTPTSSGSKTILDKIKRFDSPEQNVEERRVSRESIPERINSEGFEKFGAKRRSNSLEKSTGPESKTTLNDNTNVDLNEIPSSRNNGSALNGSVSNGAALNGSPSNYSSSGPSNGFSSNYSSNYSSNSPVPSHDDIYEKYDSQKSAPYDSHYDKAEAAANFNVNDFNIANPDNTLHELLMYLEHQTMDVISTIQTLLLSIKKQDSTRGVLRDSARAIYEVVGQMTEATNTSMSQTRNVQLREHGTWVVQNLEDCSRRMEILCGANNVSTDAEYADRNFKQRLAGVAFDIAKSTKELVKSVEELSLKQEIEVLDASLNR